MGEPSDRSGATPTNPLAGNPLRTRDDLARAVRDLFAPLLPRFSEGGARVRLGGAGAMFPEVAVELEGFARPLWGLVPLAQGGGDFDHWDLYRRGLAAGADPEHPEYWGRVAGVDQRMVEMAAIGFGLAFLPEELWEPLDARTRDRLVAWLDPINDHAPVRNNWQFFRVLVNLGLARVGRFTREDAQRESLDLLEEYYQDDGWYQDGAGGHVDYYVPWALHTYGLLYAASGLGDPERSKRYVERARRFAEHYQHWFDPQGRAIPFGRSLLYRFAQAAFWSALVLADVEALPWPRIKGLLLRNLRAWSTRPIASPEGVLSVGYGYPNLIVAEPYSSAGSPYWAMKAFLALGTPLGHPFWSAEEEPLPPLDAAVVQEPARMAITRDASQAVALSAGQTERIYANGPAKYAKLAYSSRFGFSVALAESRPHQNIHDSMLALREEHGTWRVRDEILGFALVDELVWSRWQPLPGVQVDTVLTGRCPWHWRLHRVRSDRLLHSCEAGFALGYDGIEPGLPSLAVEQEPGMLLLRTRCGCSGVRELEGGRDARMQPAPPNTNLIEPRTVVPALFGRHEPGEFTLGCAVLATDRADLAGFAAVPSPPDAMRELLESRSR